MSVKNNRYFFGVLASALMLLAGAFQSKASEPPRREYYELRVYRLGSPGQEQRVDRFLSQALIPALHRAGIKQVGVFKPIESTGERRIYLLIPYRSLDQLERVDGKLKNDPDYAASGSDYLETAHDRPPYERMEKILLKAFSGMPALALPKLNGPKAQRVYELRSYESASEKLHLNKVRMFNEGGEIGIFERLGFNAVFYGEVMAGSQMPNLMYMTAFPGMDERDRHWDTFRKDPEWKKLSSMAEYQHNVSHSDIILLKPTDYSDI